MKTNRYDLNAFYLSSLESDVFLVEVKDVVIQADDYKELFDEMLALNNGKRAWVLTETNRIKMVGSEARRYAFENGPKTLLGAGMVVNTDIARMVISFFMQVKEPPFPMKMFENRDSAYSWIKTQL